MVGNIIDKTFFFFLKRAVAVLSPAKSLKLLLDFDNKLYQIISKEAINYDKGLHPKHRLISYHDYFVKNIGKNENVLDIGCGNGALSRDIAKKTTGKVIGIDNNRENIDYANKHYRCDNLEFVYGDVLSGLPDSNIKIDTVVMSNLIEHIEKRVEFLETVLLEIKPGKVLFRVPMYEREWMVPLKEEVGVEYRLDQTHHIEYTQEDFFSELEAAGLKVKNYEVRWGEIWAEAAGNA
jgi:2-polyprenyl-3-methyl-5-hydroxy-6-metoxy-1,4-benzoquinol methylase